MFFVFIWAGRSGEDEEEAPLARQTVRESRKNRLLTQNFSPIFLADEFERVFFFSLVGGQGTS